MTNHPQLRLRYALIKDTTEGLKFVDNVPNGLKCNCVCPHCGKELVARNNPKNKREHHFAHCGGADCKGARMTTLHKLAQEIIAAAKNLYHKLVAEKERIMVIDWYKDEQPKQKVVSLIKTSLNEDMPESYDKPAFDDKTTLLLNHFIDMAVQGYGWLAA